MSDAQLVEKLRAALAAAEPPPGGATAPDAEELLETLRGERSPEEVEALVARALEDGATEELLRLLPAVEDAIADAIGEARGPGRESLRAAPAPRRRLYAVAGTLAAVLVVAALLVVGLPGGGPPPSEFREGEAAGGIEALVERGAALPREAFTLRWSAGPEGSLYDLELATEELRVFHRAAALDATEYTVPAEAFEDLDSGATVLWRIEVVLPDASRVSSPTFRVTLQ